MRFGNHVLQVNTGTADITGVTPSPATASQFSGPLSCQGSGGGTTIPLLATNAAAVCTGTFTFNQTSFSAGPMQFTGEFLSLTSLAGSVSNPAVVTPMAVAAMKAFVSQATCQTPAAAGKGLVSS